MTTKYECDITGNQYDSEEQVYTISISEGAGLYAKLDYGPDAPIEDIRDWLRGVADEIEPFHHDWYDEETDEYIPERR